MPFTFSHPSLVLPLTFLPGRWYSLTGMVIGSMTPDFEYFIRMRVQSNYSHSIAGLFWFDLPMGVALAFIFHNFARNSLILNLPKPLKARLIQFNSFDWNTAFRKNWPVVILSILIGASSHILWDGFTHENGYFVQHLSGLSELVTIAGFSIPVWKLSQHLSSIFGAIVIITAVYRLKSKPVVSKLKLSYWGVWAALTLGIIFIRLLFGLDFRMYGHVIVTAISAGLISLLFASLFNTPSHNENI